MQIHWFSLVNSLLILTLVTVAVAYFLMSALSKDINKYNDIEDSGEAAVDDSIGWKLVHRDVFRCPRKINFIAAFVGNGIQIMISMLITIACIIVGILSPSYRGGILEIAIFSYALSGTFGGYYAARIFKSFKGPVKIWINCILVVSHYLSCFFHYRWPMYNLI
jgi:transmembrane 9 superfamily member 2/4